MYGRTPSHELLGGGPDGMARVSGFAPAPPPREALHIDCDPLFANAAAVLIDHHLESHLGARRPQSQSVHPQASLWNIAAERRFGERCAHPELAYPSLSLRTSHNLRPSVLLRPPSLPQLDRRGG
jgi:hypothetical protein